MLVSFMFYYTDINECLSGQQNCHSDANCTNIKGSLHCTCKNGYQGNGSYCEGLYCVINNVWFYWLTILCIKVFNKCNRFLWEIENTHNTFGRPINWKFRRRIRWTYNIIDDLTPIKNLVLNNFTIHHINKSRRMRRDLRM